jgi:hypothetical protein
VLKKFENILYCFKQTGPTGIVLNFWFAKSSIGEWKFDAHTVFVKARSFSTIYGNHGTICELKKIQKNHVREIA